MKVLSNERVHTERLSFNSCNLEFVTVSGDVHILTKELPGGGTETSIKGELTGVGSLGNSYVLHVDETITQSSPDTVSSQSRELLVSKGSAPNQLLVSSFTFPPGDFQAEAECRG